MLDSRWLGAVLWIALSSGVSNAATTVARCDAVKLSPGGQSRLFFVPSGTAKVSFHDAPDSEATKVYVVAGDLLISESAAGEFVCASYVSGGRVSAHGWVKKSELRGFEPPSFGSFEVKSSQSHIKEANDYLSSIAKDLPVVSNWAGSFSNPSGDVIAVDRKKTSWRLNAAGINGAVGCDCDDEWEELTSEDARASHREDPAAPDVCDKVLLGFNNAIVAISGVRCMGSGADHGYPSLGGVYWKQPHP
jgi:hypothetical protein